MPTSDVDNKQWALDKIREIDPQSVLDVGPGEGTYSDLAKAHTSARWACVEAWAPYIPEFGLWGKYDHVVVSDIRHTDLMSISAPVDLAIVGDVLEHMAQAEARGVLTKLTAWADNVLVSVPLVHLEQDPHEGNWFEIHQEHWGFEQMQRELSPGLVDWKHGDVLAYYHWSCKGA